MLKYNEEKNKFTKNLCVDELDSMSMGSDCSGSSGDEFNGFKISRLEMIKFSIFSMINV